MLKIQRKLPANNCDKCGIAFGKKGTEHGRVILWYCGHIWCNACVNVELNTYYPGRCDCDQQIKGWDPIHGTDEVKVNNQEVWEKHLKNADVSLIKK